MPLENNRNNNTIEIPAGTDDNNNQQSANSNWKKERETGFLETRMLSGSMPNGALLSGALGALSIAALVAITPENNQIATTIGASAGAALCAYVVSEKAGSIWQNKARKRAESWRAEEVVISNNPSNTKLGLV